MRVLLQLHVVAAACCCSCVLLQLTATIVFCCSLLQQQPLVGAVIEIWGSLGDVRGLQGGIESWDTLSL